MPPRPARRHAAETANLRALIGPDDTAARLSSHLHLLRELVHLACGHRALESRFDVKAVLADHLHDDARAVTKIWRRIVELDGDLAAPSPELAALLDRANTPDTAVSSTRSSAKYSRGRRDVFQETRTARNTRSAFSRNMGRLRPSSPTK